MMKLKSLVTKKMFYESSPEEDDKIAFLRKEKCKLNFIFETARSIPDILVLLMKVDPDNLKLYQRILNHIMIELNKSQQRLIEEKYKPYTFKSMESVPRSFPTFALRNVYLFRWCENDIIGIKYDQLGDYIHRHPKYQKHKKETSRYVEIFAFNRRSIK
jgi:hypothetical protein